MNLSVWRDDPWVVEHVAADVVTALDDELRATRRRPLPARGITWHHRQLAYQPPNR